MQSATYKDAFGTHWMTCNALIQSPYGGGGLVAAANMRALHEARSNGEKLPFFTAFSHHIEDKERQIMFGDAQGVPQDNRDKAFVETTDMQGTQIYLNVDWKPAGEDDDVGVSPDYAFESMGKVAEYLQNNAVLDENILQEVEEAWRVEFIQENRDSIQQAVKQDVREQLEKLSEGEFVNAVYRAAVLEDAGTFEFDGYFIGDEEIAEMSDSIEYILDEGAPKPA